jgi:prephenate dehydrogenase/chorismate mutase
VTSKKLRRRRRSEEKKKKENAANNRQLLELRRKVTSITEAILKLVKTRQDLAVEIAGIKVRKNLAIDSPSVESGLAERTRTLARSLRLDEGVASTVLETLIAQSKIAQARSVAVKRASAFLDSRGIGRVGIVGAGRMGRWFGAYFLALERRVAFFDKSSSRARAAAREVSGRAIFALEEITEDSDLIVVAAPIAETAAILSRIAKAAAGRSRPLHVIEISSIKKPVLADSPLSQQISRDEPPLPLLHSTHPLYGPGAEPFARHNLLEVRTTKRASDSAFIKSVFPLFRVVTMDWRDHDRAMAYTLSLPHLIVLAFGNTLKKSPLKGRRRNSVLGGPSFEALRSLVARVTAEDPGVYFQIQALNPFSGEALRRFTAVLSSLATAIEGGDYAAFRKAFSTKA